MATIQRKKRRGRLERTILHRGKSAIVVAVDVKTLVAEAENAKGVIEFAPQVGDFVGLGEPLFVLYGGAGVIDERKLQTSVVSALHQELNLLDQMIGKLYALSEDLALARIPDSQGLGGSSGAKALAWRNAIYESASDFPSVTKTETK